MNSDDTISRRLKRFHDSQSERLVTHLELANKKLKIETQTLKDEVLKTQEILDFHYQLEKEFFSRYDPQLSKYGVDKQEAGLIIRNLLKDPKVSSEWKDYRSEIQLQAKSFKNHYKFQSEIL